MDKTEYVVDSFSAIFHVAKIEGGMKVGEITINLPRGYYPPDLSQTLALAAAQAKAMDEANAAA